MIKDQLGVEQIAEDLAPGDRGSLKFNWKDLEVVRIDSTDHPFFSLVYDQLWKEFGEKGEVEQREVLAKRMLWSGPRLRYEMIGVHKKGEFVAVRDHTAITSDGESVVHLSHVLIAPEFRGTGLIGWLRAWPIQLARRSLVRAGFRPDGPITLAGEMEPYDSRFSDRVARLKSYENAGFQMIETDYLQPDFRSPEIIDETGGAMPIPLKLIVRRVGLESDETLPGSEVRRIVTALYSMYEEGFRKQDMEKVWNHLRIYYPEDEANVRLLKPVGAKR